MLCNLLPNTVYVCYVFVDVQEKCTSIFVSLREKGEKYEVKHVVWMGQVRYAYRISCRNLLKNGHLEDCDVGDGRIKLS